MSTTDQEHAARAQLVTKVQTLEGALAHLQATDPHKGDFSDVGVIIEVHFRENRTIHQFWEARNYLGLNLHLAHEAKRKMQRLPQLILSQEVTAAQLKQEARCILVLEALACMTSHVLQTA